MTEKCDNCGKERPTVPWRGHLDSINAIRMRSSLPRWCATCTLEAQLKYAKEESARLFARIPELEKCLKEAYDKA